VMTGAPPAVIQSSRRREQCSRCGTQLAASLLTCPGCHALVHAEELRQLAADAGAAEQKGDVAGALTKWRTALELLPADSQQHAQIMSRTTDLAKRTDAGVAASKSAGSPMHPLRRAWAAIVTGTLLVLSKAKLLLLGLTKLGTLTSLLLFLGIYWQLWGWQFALGFVLSIYIHEMGHVAALARYGIAASAPMFVPGLGAFVRLKQYPSDVRQDARVGLAGPIWGLGAALAAYGAYLAMRAPVWGAIAQTGGYINLFNLIPIWQLDGGRGFRSLSRPERWLAAGALVATWAVTRQGLLILLATGAVYRAFNADAPRERDWQTLASYVGLIVALTWLSLLHVPTGGLVAQH